MNVESTYLLSSFKKNPDMFFQGYCFNKEDLIIGQYGAEMYLRQKGKEISFGEDGCYVLAKKINGKYIIGSDFSGYKKVLYYYDEKTGNWAVSNSLILLTEHLSENSILFTPNVPMLLVSAERLPYTQQPLTFNTIINEIEILPINSLLIIGNDTFEIESVKDSISENKNYEEILSNFVNIWASRFKTLFLNKDIFIQQGLTGGLDSRSVFSLSNIAFRFNEKQNKAKYRLMCGLTKGDDKDIKAAKNIANKYGYELNKKDVSYYSPNFLCTEDKYSIWKYLCLGLYQPIYFPNERPSYKKISVGGGGGENHRVSYGSNPQTRNYNDFIRFLCRRLPDSTKSVDLAIDLYETLLFMNELDIYDGKIDPLILHYRHFRNRFHSGLFPQYSFSFTPLSSRYLANIATEKNSSRVDTSQILYDLINLTDDLIMEPYDDYKKMPSSEVLDKITKVSDDITIKSGSVFIGQDTMHQELSEKPSKQPLRLLRKDFKKACESEFVKSLWDETFISNAETKLNEALRLGKFKYPTDGSHVSLIIASSLFDLNQEIINVNISEKDGKTFLSARLILKDITDKEFAFYFYKNNSRIKVYWYSNQYNINMDISNNSGVYHAVGFIKDKKGNKPKLITSEKVIYNVKFKDTMK